MPVSYSNSYKFDKIKITYNIIVNFAFTLLNILQTCMRTTKLFPSFIFVYTVLKGVHLSPDK